MCRQERLRILEDISSPGSTNMLLYDHTPVHLTFETKTIPFTRYLPLTHFRENQDGSIKIFVRSKKIDTFTCELVIAYILNCIGIERYICNIQIFEDVNDICILETFVYMMNKRFSIDLRLLSGEEGMQILLQGRVIYKTDIL